MCGRFTSQLECDCGWGTVKAGQKQKQLGIELRRLLVGVRYCNGQYGTIIIIIGLRWLENRSEALCKKETVGHFFVAVVCSISLPLGRWHYNKLTELVIFL